MPTSSTWQDSLVIYKKRPARVVKAADKLEIQEADGQTRNVRPKDVLLLHEGPFTNFNTLKHPDGELLTAWELMQGETTTLQELAELIYEEFTPQAAFATWEFMQDGLYFKGTIDEIYVNTREQVDAEVQTRQAKDDKKKQWEDFIDRVKQRKLVPEDHELMHEVEAVANGRGENSKIMTEMGLQPVPESAHDLLLKTGVWDECVNPYPKRHQLDQPPKYHPVPEVPEEDRLDLTHLPAYAIDDEGNTDPDDALSLDGEKIWVHIADVAAVVAPGSPLDLEASSISANLYLPEGKLDMLPREATEKLGLGLHEISPALSFGLTLDKDGNIASAEIKPTLVKVTRLTYGDAEAELENGTLAALWQKALHFRASREAADAVTINLPEVKISVRDRIVEIKPLPELNSRELVAECMLMAGAAAARFADDNIIPVPYVMQPPPEEPIGTPETLAEKYASLRFMQRSVVQMSPDLHSGLGLKAYTRVTSPLRRYTDLVVHQQIRAFITGKRVAYAESVFERVSASEAMSGNVRMCERKSNRHWTMVYLSQQADWQSEAILLDQRGHRGRVYLPELGCDAEMHLNKTYALNDKISVQISRLKFPELEIILKEVE